MKLKRKHVILYVAAICSLAIFIVNLNYDRFSRNKSINVTNVSVVDQYLSNEEITYLIDNNIDFNLFSKFIRDDNFVLMNYQYYNLIDKYYPTYSIKDIVNYGNQIVEKEYRLKKLDLILESYTPVQMLELVEYQNSVKDVNPNISAQFYPATNVAYVNSTNYILDYKPKNLVQINSKYLKNSTSKIYINKNAYDKFEQLCSDLSLISNTFCGGLKIDAAYVSYEEFDKTPNSLKQFVTHESNELQLAKSIVFSGDITKSDSYLWLLENSYLYGFIQRYPDNKITSTKVSNNLNVFRFVGIDEANKIYTNKWSLEEYK